MQADQAFDQLILATEQAEDVNLGGWEQQLPSKQDALHAANIRLQDLQASLPHHVSADYMWGCTYLVTLVDLTSCGIS